MLPSPATNGHTDVGRNEMHVCVMPPPEQRLSAMPVLMIAVYNLISEDATRLEHDEQHINALAEDFRRRLKAKPDECPVQTPLRVIRRGRKFQIVAGNHRFAAALRIPIAELPCIILPDDLDEAGLIIEAANDNELHHGYNPIERARNVLRVVELRGCTPVEAGRPMGIKAPDVTKLLRVLRGYPESLWPLIGEGDGKVPFTTAYALSRLHPDEAKIRELTELVVKGALNRNKAEAKVSQLLGKKPKEQTLTFKVDGMTITVKKPTAESIQVAINKLAVALKRLKPSDDISDLCYHLKSA